MLTISFAKALNIKNNKDYCRITQGRHALHQEGTLYGLLVRPESFNPSLFAIARQNKKPVGLVSITKNYQRKGMCNATPSLPLGDNLSFQFPNFEIMAYVDYDHRRKGIAEKAIKALLEKANASENDAIYVYSISMASLVKKIGYTNVTNLHEHTP